MRRVLFALLFISCASSTYVTDVYRDPSAGATSFQRVAAIVMVQDPAVRKQAEDEMVRQIGSRAVASYTLLSAEDERGPEVVRAKLQSQGIDGAVTMRLLSAGEEPLDVGGNVGDPNKAFSGYYAGGRTNTTAWEQVVRVETEIFSIADNKLLWSGATKTFNAEEAKDIVANVSKTVSAELRKSGLMK